MRDMVKMVVVLTAICAVSGFALAFLNDATREARAYQLLKFVKEPSIKAVFSSLDYDNDPIKDRVDVKIGNEQKSIFLAKREGQIIAIAFDTAASGYGGPVEVMVGFKSDGTLVGIGIMKHSETPGLGAKITEDTFVQQFCNKKPPLKLAAQGGTINAVTGATISSTAVVTAVNQAVEAFSEIRGEVF